MSDKSKETVIEVKDLCRDYITGNKLLGRKRKVVHAVNGIDFEVNRGEIFGLLGENGAGKTTTIKMLTTLLAPTGGTCKVLGGKNSNEKSKSSYKYDDVADETVIYSSNVSILPIGKSNTKHDFVV